MICNRCHTEQGDEFYLGEKICKKCKKQQYWERKLKKIKAEEEARRQLRIIFSGVREE